MYKSKITICNVDFPIKSTESEEYTDFLTEKLNTQVKQVMNSTKSNNITCSLVIAALSILDEKQHLYDELKTLVTEKAQLEQQISEYKATIDELNSRLK